VRQKDTAFVVPPAGAVIVRTVASPCVVVHVRRCKFHPVVRVHYCGMTEEEHIVDATSNTTHNIASDVLAFGLNND